MVPLKKMLIMDPWFQDVTTKVLSYCGNGLAVHIFSAHGVVRNVTLRHTNSPYERVVYEVRSIVLAWKLYIRNPFLLVCFRNVLKVQPN